MPFVLAVSSTNHTATKAGPGKEEQHKDDEFGDDLEVTRVLPLDQLIVGRFACSGSYPVWINFLV